MTMNNVQHLLYNFSFNSTDSDRSIAAEGRGLVVTPPFKIRDWFVSNNDDGSERLLKTLNFFFELCNYYDNVESGDTTIGYCGDTVGVVGVVMALCWVGCWGCKLRSLFFVHELRLQTSQLPILQIQRLLAVIEPLWFPPPQLHHWQAQEGGDEGGSPNIVVCPPNSHRFPPFPNGTSIRQNGWPGYNYIRVIVP